MIPAPRRVLGLACGSGRHVRWLHAPGGTLSPRDRDAPAPLGSIALSAFANQSLRVGNNVVGVSSDWWSKRAERVERRPGGSV